MKIATTIRRKGKYFARLLFKNGTGQVIYFRSHTNKNDLLDDVQNSFPNDVHFVPLDKFNYELDCVNLFGIAPTAPYKSPNEKYPDDKENPWLNN